MSRIIVKNIPDYLDEKRLKQHIGAHIGNDITDIKIVRRPDGTSRKFGFVGFKKEENAIEAQRYFDKTFIDTARINVSIARAINDETLKEEKARKRGGQGVVVENKNAEKKDEKSGEEAKKSSSKGISFEEFMEVMKPRSKRKAWGNGENQDADAALDPATFSEEAPKAAKKRKSTKEDDANAGKETDEAEKEVAADSAVNDEGMTDLEYMYKRMKRKVGADLEEEEQKAFEQSDDEDAGGEKKKEIAASDESEEEEEEEVDEKEAQKQERQRIALEKKAKKDQEDADSIMESGRLFVRNLPFETVEDDLEEYFSKFGQVAQAHITLDKATKKAKGIAFVTFTEPAHALSAFRAADGHTFQGRLLHILPAAQKNENATDPSTLKGRKKQDMKANATKDFNWNTLYMSSDAVASSVAARLGIEKTDILNPQDGEQNTSVSPAVRLALAETSVINETRDFLKGEGINVDAFEGEQKQKRSDTVILVKNIPYGTTSEALQSMFEKHGTVERTVMPPTGTIAIVEMQLPGEAKVAFRSLAYKRLGNSVLYLEKAPVGIMGSKPAASDVTSKADDQAKEEQSQLAGTKPAEVPTDGTAAAGATLFVKNLSFSTTDERLASAFGKLTDVTFVRVQKRSVRQRDGKGEVKLSMGFGFVGFRSVESARIAQKVMDKSMLDGHLLNVTFAKRGHDADDEVVGRKSANEERTSAPSTKLIVKNLAFQATKKDVRALFAAHGKLKSVRVPRKGMSSVGGTAGGVRGFGFVEFVNRNEALNAYQALRHSHLLGRHMILDWDLEGNSAATSAADSTAEDQGTSIDRLRRKAAQQAAISQAASGPGGAHKRGKLRLNDEDIKQAALDEKRRAVEDDDEDEEEED